jgi:hypothetical protein
VHTSFILSYLLILLFTFLIFIGFTYLQKIFYDKLRIELRFKDIYSVNIYSFIPLILSLIFIFPVELVVLGGDIFSNNPNPFQIKPTISYLLSGFEVFTFLWSIYLVNKCSLLISGKLLWAILLTIIFVVLLISMYILSSHLIFSI